MKLYRASISSWAEYRWRPDEPSQKRFMKATKRVELGEYVVANPEICHGQLTFKGTRIMVKSVLFYVGQGKDWHDLAGVF